MPEERKLVTVLFADVTGSTTLGEALDPEDVRVLMARYYQHAQRVIVAHGGTLEKFIGDAVMAVFGLPQAHGDDADRALAAAVALRAAMAMDTLLAGRLLLRIGVNTGEVVASTRPASGDFLVTGDAVNVAARLQQGANPGEILASERTAAATQATFLFAHDRLVKVKGKSQRLRAFPVNLARSERRRTRPPFVGRRQDLQQLDLLRARILEEHQPELVSILAPAGTGKTRLLEEFLARLDPADGFQVAIARCPPYGQTLTYWPLRGLLADLLGGDPASQPVTGVLRDGGHHPADAARLANLVVSTLGIDADGQQDPLADRETIFNAWRLLIEAFARQAPRILIFDNLHWASDSLLDLVEHITQPRTQAPLLLVALSRPELLDRRPSWGGGRPSFTALALRPLSEANMRDLVGRLMEGLPAAPREEIVERAGGNPFFAIELARGQAERALAGEAIGGGALPDTVHAAVLARLDLLSARERAVLQAAAVAARIFSPDMVGAVLDDLDATALDAALDGLLARDLIATVDGGAYTFRHILIREVAYGTLARADRVRMHTRLAAWLEAHAAARLDEFTELIAYHYREALLLARQSAVPLDLPVAPERAVFFLARAGDLASRSGAYIEARNHLQSAIALAPQERHAGLYEHLGDCVLQSLSDTAAEAYRDALERWRAGADPDPLTGARLMRKLLIAVTRWNARLPDQLALQELRAEARQLGEAAGDEDERWRIRVADLYWALPRGDIPREEVEAGRAVALAAVAHFEARADWPAFSEALDIYSWLSTILGAHADALEASQRRLAAPELPAAERGDAVNTVARAYFNLGDYDRCIAIVREALEQVRPGESVAHLAVGASRPASVVPLAYGVSRAAVAAWYTGRWDELGIFITAVERAWEQLQHEPSSSLVTGYLVALHVARAREDRAAADAATAALERLATGDQDGEWHRLFAAYREDDPCELLTPPLDVWPAAVPYPEVLMFLSERGVRAPPSLLEAAGTEARAEQIAFPLHCVEIAEALAAEDNTRLAAAIDGAEAGSMLPHAARIRIVLAQRACDRSQLEQARPVLERLGDRQFLRRLGEVEAALR
jgi:class 3 adenylate cyclase/tetratricopeptide (TPR) repeat protein